MAAAAVRGALRKLVSSAAGAAGLGTHACQRHKMSLVVRTDLGMGKGKIASQCAHAAVGAYSAAQRSAPRAVTAWEGDGQPKVALKAASQEQM